jgi:hypothetical protein
MVVETSSCAVIYDSACYNFVESSGCAIAQNPLVKGGVQNQLSSECFILSRVYVWDEIWLVLTMLFISAKT